MVDKFQKSIMVVERELLFESEPFQGFAPAKGVDYYSRILRHYRYHVRGEAETRPDLKQPIAYCLIAHRNSKKVFAYQRSTKAGEYSEARLRGKWSWGIGGHIDQIDGKGEDPLRASMVRELEEEIRIEGFDTPQILGYINDDETAVGQVHFGVLFLLLTDDDRVHQNDKEIAWGGFKSIEELQAICADPQAQVESWSEISLPPLRLALERC
ncbi:NUDIX domain-containing protein [candidate division KSB1 bacterium]|nr:NUDIX domain-containing protein [candidate division KSB1 bacterium]